MGVRSSKLKFEQAPADIRAHAKSLGQSKESKEPNPMAATDINEAMLRAGPSTSRSAAAMTTTESEEIYANSCSSSGDNVNAGAGAGIYDSLPSSSGGAGSSSGSGSGSGSGSKQIVINIQLLKVENERNAATLSGCSELIMNGNMNIAAAMRAPADNRIDCATTADANLETIQTAAASTEMGTMNANAEAQMVENYGYDELPEYCEVLEQAVEELRPNTEHEEEKEERELELSSAVPIDVSTGLRRSSSKLTGKTKFPNFLREFCSCVRPTAKRKAKALAQNSAHQNAAVSNFNLAVLSKESAPLDANGLIKNVVMRIHIPPPLFEEERRLAKLANSRTEYAHHLVPDLDKIYNSSYYWGNIDRQEADKLMQGKPDGTFLLRDSAQEEFLFSVTYRKYNMLLHVRIEHAGHKFSFDCHDPEVKKTDTITDLMEHYKEPSPGGVMFFEPILKIPLHRNHTFSLQDLCRAKIASNITYNGVNQLDLPKHLKKYIQNYHYKIKLRSKEIHVFV